MRPNFVVDWLPHIYWRYKGKAVPQHTYGGTEEEGKYSSYSFMTSALDRVSGQRHDPAVFTPGERTHGNHFAGGWVGPRAGLDTDVRGKIL
jgi:hypothetical protein